MRRATPLVWKGQGSFPSGLRKRSQSRKEGFHEREGSDSLPYFQEGRHPPCRTSGLRPPGWTGAAGQRYGGGHSGPARRATLPRTRQLIAGKKPVRVVLYGDSISEVGRSPTWNGGRGRPGPTGRAQLVQLLAKEYPDSSFTVHHFAIGGQNSYEGLGRLDGLKAFNPDLVIVAFGANDCGYHYLLPEETKLALTTLARAIRGRFGADVALSGTGGDNPLKPIFRHLDETIAAQRQAAAEAKVPFVDLRAAVLKATENGKRWAEFHLNANNCHPNNAGHQVWAEAAFQVIQESLKGQP